MIRDDLIAIAAVAVPLAHLLGIVSAVFAVMRSRTPQGSIAWAIALITFPYVAIPLYWVLGRNRFHGYVELLRAYRLENKADVAATLKPIHAFRAELTPGQAARFGVLERLAKLPFTRDNDAELLIDGKATFDAIFAAISEARAYVLLQFYIVRDDELGRALRSLLESKAKSGVRVHFLYDGIGSFGLAAGYGQSLRAAGVQMEEFRTTRGFGNRFQINFRNHHKIVVVDGRIGFVGGLNVGDEYMGRSPRFGPWRDTFVRLEGPAVQALQLAFLGDWYWATRAVPDLDWNSRPSEHGHRSLLVLPTGPADAEETCSLFLLQAIVSARTRLWIASPYFVPDEPVFAALKLAALRGVDVRIMVPEKPDHLLIHLASFSFLPVAEMAGIRIYRYSSAFLHQKVVLVDEELAAVGTANLDNRSLRLNFEITLVALDAEFASQVADMLERDFSRCRLATGREFLDRGFAFRAAVKVARLFDPVL